MNDPICVDPNSNNGLDTTLFSSITSSGFDKTSFYPFLCEVMKLAGIDNIDPILYSPNPVDYSSTILNFSSLTGVGNPRISLGHVLSAAFNEFFPLALAQVEVIRSGGCQVVDGYICDSDGNRKKEMTVYCPPNFTTVPITPTQIIERTTEIIMKGIDDSAKRFSDYIISLRNNGWTDTLYMYKIFSIFYVKLTKGTGILYLKYYPDAAPNVSKYLNKPINYRNDSQVDSQEHANALSEIIPKY